MKRLFFALILLLPAISMAQTKYNVTSSSVTYVVKNLGINTGGGFGGLQTASIVFDKQHLDASSIQATVDVKKLDSGIDSRDEHMKGADFFDVEHYPTITIKSVSFKQKGGNKFVGVFDLTLKATTKRIEIPFTLTDTGSNAVFQGSFKINRMDYGVGGSTLTLSNDVTIAVNIQAAK
ncbi:polyisoprenoid-binding protein YceI [Mucilaginibacter yixingensis]|uniref:Polyisoprenoid-binding protein YceI n=1 Tax=Mucilaginibacter yixingensis TaxID=1295612 RepID=A0A2T5J7W3_9SPHI|nr:YceI family protein [Mucilaginibacter yixingensis]PTQ95558.1 polyisoprenoid-binding protein YceI [Mucilaginibacter yixingensis]